MLTADLVFVGSGIFHVCCDEFGFVHESNELIFIFLSKSGDPAKRARAIVQAVSNYDYYYYARSYTHLTGNTRQQP